MDKTEVLIIGQGPAGLSAAIYTGRAGIKTEILGCNPKVAGDYDIDNYFGFPETVSGKELLDLGLKQALRFGAHTECDRVVSIHYGESGGFTVKTETKKIETCSIILSTGLSRKKAPIPGLEKFEGKGISYCVSCDGFFFKNKKVVVAGEGNYAANQALELHEYTNDVTICTLGKKTAISQEFMDRLDIHGIKIIEDSILNLEGDDNLSGIVYSGIGAAPADGIFIALGEASSLDFAASLGLFTKDGFITVDRDMKTNIPGIFAAGDCTGGFLQISKAVGEGAVAAKSAIDFIRETCR